MIVQDVISDVLLGLSVLVVLASAVGVLRRRRIPGSRRSRRRKRARPAAAGNARRCP